MKLLPVIVDANNLGLSLPLTKITRKDGFVRSAKLTEVFQNHESIANLQHPIPSHTIISFVGKNYEILAPVCRLFNRETLPHPCCNVGEWKGRRWSYRAGWRREVGHQFIADRDAKKHPTYLVKDFAANQIYVKTFWNIKLTKQEQLWWTTPQHLLNQNLKDCAA